jgi:hypothetical protein
MGVIVSSPFTVGQIGKTEITKCQPLGTEVGLSNMMIRLRLSTNNRRLSL